MGSITNILNISKYKVLNYTNKIIKKFFIDFLNNMVEIGCPDIMYKLTSRNFQ